MIFRYKTLATEIHIYDFNLTGNSVEIELFNKATNGISISSLGVKVDSGDNIPSDSLWSVQLKTNCNNLDLTETNIRTDSEVCFDNISTNFSNDTQAIIKLTSESSLSNVKGMCSVKLDI
tara:strand:+ start:2162 stop:2521 length:360 start_codon:yes stop_codon:yes gene_type:complete